jgi:hypothetical protein
MPTTPTGHDDVTTWLTTMLSIAIGFKYFVVFSLLPTKFLVFHAQTLILSPPDPNPAANSPYFSPITLTAASSRNSVNWRIIANFTGQRRHRTTNTYQT